MVGPDDAGIAVIVPSLATAWAFTPGTTARTVAAPLVMQITFDDRVDFAIGTVWPVAARCRTCVQSQPITRVALPDRKSEPLSAQRDSRTLHCQTTFTQSA
jgi:hypothetical protein